MLNDGNVVDDYVGGRMQLALGTQCGGGQAQRTLSQDAPGILDPTTNRPLLGSEDLAVLGGGEAKQRANAYFVATPAWPLVPTNDLIGVTWTERATGTVVLQAPFLALSSTHDYGLVVLARDPSGATVLTGYGVGAPGTLAAGFLFETVIAPAMQTDGRSWYVFEWTNGDSDDNPTPGDTLTILGSGP